MLLAIDIGNTNTVFAAYEERDCDFMLVDSWRCITEARRSADEYAVFINNLFALAEIKLSDIHHIIVSSVVPHVNFHVRMFCKNYLGHDPLFVDHKIANIEIALPKPDEIGADRLVNAIGLKAHYDVPAIVIDFGTATTFDVIDAQGRYAGGVIAPGINLSLNALQNAAARLPNISIEKPDRVVGVDTVGAMRSGMYWGYMSLIEGMIGHIRNEINNDPYVLATGGLAPLFAKDLNLINTVDDMLTLKGLIEIYKHYNLKE